MSKLAAALAGKTAPTPYEVLRAQVERLRPEIAALCGRDNVDKFIRVCLNAVQANPAILNANRRTLLVACLKAAQDNLLPDGREAVLNIFRTKVKKEGREEWIEQVQYMPMAYGLVQKFYEAGATYVDGVAVYERELDAFEYRRGDEPHITHKPWLGDDDPGKVVAAYAIVKLKTGETKREVMSRREIERVRLKSKQPEGLMWSEFYDQGSIKSVLHRIAKQLPRAESLARALAHDREVTGLAVAEEPIATEAPGTTIEALVDGRMDAELRDQALKARPQEAEQSAPTMKQPVDRPQGTPEVKAKFLRQMAEATDRDVLSIIADDANFYVWLQADSHEIASAYRARLAELEQKP